MEFSKKPVTIKQEPRIEIHQDHITAVFYLDQFEEGVSIGIRFNSPEEVLEFSTKLMEAASRRWPENEYIKEYQDER
jgi:hypothetical protein